MSGVQADDTLIARVRSAIAEREGRYDVVAKEAEVGRDALARLIAGLPVKRGTIALVTLYLNKIETKGA